MTRTSRYPLMTVITMTMVVRPTPSGSFQIAIDQILVAATDDSMPADRRAV